MSRKALWITIGSLVVAAFLLGFIPQYMRGRNLESQLGTIRQELNAESEKLQRGELGLLIGYAYLQANQKNYGFASQYSTKFFDRARALAGQVSDPSWQTFLQGALARRDEVIGGLAKGDPSTVAAVQDLFQRTLDATQTGRQ